MPIHDVLAVAAVMVPKLFTWQSMPGIPLEANMATG